MSTETGKKAQKRGPVIYSSSRDPGKKRYMCSCFPELGTAFGGAKVFSINTMMISGEYGPKFLVMDHLYAEKQP
jgi:hypothetical protein